MTKLAASIVIPAHNEGDFIQKSVTAALKQDGITNFEVIVVNNNSSDNTAEQAKSAGAIIVNEPIQGLPKAREAGRKAAQGEIVIYIDADTLIPAHYVKTICDYFAQHPECAGVSNVFYFHDGNWRNNLGIWYFHNMQWRFHNFILTLFRKPGFLYGPNFAVRSAILDKIGGFNTSIKFYGEDSDTTKRVSREGKLAFLWNLKTLTSARRYQREGTLNVCFNYLVNYIAINLFDKPIHLNRWQTTLGKTIFMTTLFFLIYILIKKFI